MRSKLWDEILIHSTHYNGCSYLFMLWWIFNLQAVSSATTIPHVPLFLAEIATLTPLEVVAVRRVKSSKPTTRVSYIQGIEFHYSDVIMAAIASQITSLFIVYSTVYSGVHQRKHQSSTSLAIVPGIHRWPVNSPHKWPVTRRMFPSDDVIMQYGNFVYRNVTVDGRKTPKANFGTPR